MFRYSTIHPNTHILEEIDPTIHIGSILSLATFGYSSLWLYLDILVCIEGD
jgi:hypothetical protein